MVRKLLALIVAITGIALICPALAQPGPAGPGGPEPGGGIAPGKVPGRDNLRRAAGGRGGASGLLTAMYDPQTVTTVKGAVETLGTMPPRGWGAIRSAVLKTDQGNITVYLSPDWHLAQQKISLKAGDQLEATGSKATLGEQPCVIAKDLKVDGKTVTLRDDQGVPVWRGQRPPRVPVKPSNPNPVSADTPGKSGAPASPAGQ
jgi:hypothetical protein